MHNSAHAQLHILYRTVYLLRTEWALYVYYSRGSRFFKIKFAQIKKWHLGAVAFGNSKIYLLLAFFGYSKLFLPNLRSLAYENFMYWQHSKCMKQWPTIWISVAVLGTAQFLHTDYLIFISTTNQNIRGTIIHEFTVSLCNSSNSLRRHKQQWKLSFFSNFLFIFI